MVQEIITYIIIGVAVVVAVLKIQKKFLSKTKNINTNKTMTQVHQHNCSDCSAECVLRDAATPDVQNNRELCRKIETAASD
jgi:hypothetical protein